MRLDKATVAEINNALMGTTDVHVKDPEYPEGAGWYTFVWNADTGVMTLLAPKVEEEICDWTCETPHDAFEQFIHCGILYDHEITVGVGPWRQ